MAPQVSPEKGVFSPQNSAPADGAAWSCPFPAASDPSPVLQDTEPGLLNIQVGKRQYDELQASF